MSFNNPTNQLTTNRNNKKKKHEEEDDETTNYYFYEERDEDIISKPSFFLNNSSSREKKKKHNKDCIEVLLMKVIFANDIIDADNEIKIKYPTKESIYLPSDDEDEDEYYPEESDNDEDPDLMMECYEGACCQARITWGQNHPDYYALVEGKKIRWSKEEENYLKALVNKKAEKGTSNLMLRCLKHVMHDIKATPIFHIRHILSVEERLHSIWLIRKN
jgi:hypothetical protein